MKTLLKSVHIYQLLQEKFGAVFLAHPVDLSTNNTIECTIRYDTIR